MTARILKKAVSTTEYKVIVDSWYKKRWPSSS